MKLSKLLGELTFYVQDNDSQLFSNDPDIFRIRKWPPVSDDPHTLYLAEGREEESAHPWGENHILFCNEPVPSGCSFGVSVYGEVTLPEIRDCLQENLDQEASVSASFHDLYRIAKRHPTLEKFIKSVYDILGNDVFVVSASFSILAAVLNKSDSADTFTKQADGTYLSREAITFIHKIGGLERLSESREPFFVEKGYFPYSAIITSIRVKQKVIGYLCVLDTDHPFSRTDTMLCDNIAELLSQMLYFTDTKTVGEDASSTTLLENLLTGNQENVMSYANVWGWDQYLSMRSFLLIACTVNPGENKANITNLFYQIKSVFRNSAIVQMAHCFVILLCGKNRVRLTEEKKRSLESVVRLHKEKCVIGFDYTDIFSTLDHFHFLQSALGLVVTNHNENHALYEMEELYFLILVNGGMDLSQKKQLIHPDILFLNKYDSENGSDLANTLRYYLNCNRNITAMAQSLHISRSTGFYRMNLIRDLLNDSISDSQKLFCYECSFELLKQIT